jgi:predicted metal-dependent hydrolase
MNRTIVSFAFAAVLALTSFAAKAQTQPNPEKLTNQQLLSLIATAKTPAEHQRIAQYYEAKALDYQAQAREHEQMVAAYKGNSSLSTNKNQASTVSHCEHFVAILNAQAAKSQELAASHQQMADEASEKLPSAGK